MDKKTITIIALSLILGMILISFAGVYTYNKIYEKGYNQGSQEVNLLVQQQIFQSIQQNGYVPFSFEVNGEVQTINLVPYQNLNNPESLQTQGSVNNGN